MSRARQGSLDLPCTGIDLARFVDFTPSVHDTSWRVSGIGGRRSGEVGQEVGVIGLRHAPGYEVLLRFEDGDVDSFAPHALFPG